MLWEIEELAFGRAMNRQILILRAIEFRTDELFNFACISEPEGKNMRGKCCLKECSEWVGGTTQLDGRV